LIKTAKKFKKEKVNVDIICFGDEANTNYEKLKSFLETLNSKDGTGSHIIAVPPGSELNQALLTSPIVRNEDGTAPAVGGGHGGFFEVDPNEDPELALALRVSLEEQRARQEQEAAAATAASTERPAAATAAAAGTGTMATGLDPPPMMQMPANFDQLSEEDQIALALQMSLEQNQPQESDVVPESDEKSVDNSVDVEPMDTADPSASAEDDIGALMADPHALEALVSTLPGVDTTSQVVQQAMAQAAAEEKQTAKKQATNGGKEKETKDKGKGK